jgi:hypothetical protein
MQMLINTPKYLESYLLTFKTLSVGRSQSVGPTVTDGGSPKKQPKPMSASVTAATASSQAKAHTKKTPASTPTVTAEHQPRPSKLKRLKTDAIFDNVR